MRYIIEIYNRDIIEMFEAQNPHQECLIGSIAYNFDLKAIPPQLTEGHYAECSLILVVISTL
jgi:hypothetical protein